MSCAAAATALPWLPSLCEDSQSEPQRATGATEGAREDGSSGQLCTARAASEARAGSAAAEELKRSAVPSQGRPGTTRLLLVRHGETVWNAEKRVQGQLDIELNEVGRGQARKVASAIQQLGLSSKVDAVISSDLARASETADILATACPGALRRRDAGLREINFGDLQGNLAKDVKSRRTEIMDAWAQGQFDRAFPGGESAEAVVGRGLRSLRAAAGAGECVVVVAHGSIMRWCAICIELGGEGAAPCAESMTQQRITSLLEAQVRNCCCSHLVYDHKAQRFQSEGWFEVLDTSSVARDDTG